MGTEAGVPVTTTSQGLIEARWLRFDSKRSIHLNRCRQCTELTIPALLPKEGVTENTELPTPYQALGARAVNNLSAKLLLALFPPNTSFMKLDIPDMVIEELKEEMGDKGFKQKVEKRLRQFEQAVVKDFEAKAARTKMFRAIRLLVTTGNALLEIKDDGTVKVYRLDKYVVRRAPDGSVREIVIKELINEEDVPDEIKQNPAAQRYTKNQVEAEDIPLYTQAILVDGSWKVKQETMGMIVPDSLANYPKDKLPFLALTWTLNDGENYGRGQVEETLGDWISYDSLSQSLLEGAAACAYLLFLLKPNSTTNLKDLQKARNGQFVNGNVDDIGVLRVEKAHDFQVAYEQAKEVEGRLARAFLLQESIQRQAERVTAEEIRLMAQELENGLGGIYSVLGVELQKPLSTIQMSNMRKRGLLPELPKGVTITITTGFEALGRGHDLAKLREFRDEVVAMAQAVQQPDLAELYIGMSNYFTRVANAIGLDTDGLVPTEEEIKAAQEQKAQMAQMTELAKTGAATQVAKGMMDQGGMPNG